MKAKRRKREDEDKTLLSSHCSAEPTLTHLSQVEQLGRSWCSL